MGHIRGYPLIHIRVEGEPMRSVVESVGIESDEETFYLIGGEYCNPPSLTRALNVPER
jgi:hypothetical protein